MPYISDELRAATTELAMDPAREIWGLFLDPVLDLLKSHVLAHYAEHRLTSSQACMLQRLDHPMPQREAALQLGYDPSNITALADAPAEGERLVRALDESLAHPPESLSRLSPDEQKQLLRLLSRAFGPNS